MSNQRYCGWCGTAMHNDRPCTCGYPNWEQQKINQLSRIANALEDMNAPSLYRPEIDEIDYRRGYTD